ncbi:hypothetical protein GOODEAATRI_032699, partial [Goodea atripinnis]
DPSVTQVTNSSIEPVDQYNPFPQSNDYPATHTTPASTSPYQPAVLQPSTEPSPQVGTLALLVSLALRGEMSVARGGLLPSVLFLFMCQLHFMNNNCFLQLVQRKEVLV